VQTRKSSYKLKTTTPDARGGIYRPEVTACIASFDKDCFWVGEIFFALRGLLSEAAGLDRRTGSRCTQHENSAQNTHANTHKQR
jgi:hypothetical protein